MRLPTLTVLLSYFPMTQGHDFCATSLMTDRQDWAGMSELDRVKGLEEEWFFHAMARRRQLAER